MTTRARAAEIADADVTWRDRVELLVTEPNGASSRVLCIPFEGEDTAAAAAPPTRHEDPSRGL
ncbi:MAG: hypothetical protein IPL61_13030 [Myxococcales bacterium]|nr:hypothetical protein [Myxococcales bacterium]